MRFDDVAIQGILQARRVMGRAPFPGQKEVEVGIRLLSDRDGDLCRFEAQMYLERQCKKLQLTPVDVSNIDPELLFREHMRQVLLRAIVDPEGNQEAPQPFFDDISQVRSLDSVSVQQLWDSYEDFGDTVNPRLKMTQEEVDQLAAALKDEPSEKIILAPLGRDTLQGLVRIMAAHLRTSLIGKSSTSST